jgi:hypothetical protein
MNPITTQIKAAKKAALVQLERAKKNVLKTEAQLHAAAKVHGEAKNQIGIAEAEVAKHDAVLKLYEGSEPTASPAKPGPKAKAAPAAKTAAKTVAPAAKKTATAAKAVVPAAKVAGKSRAADGRREVLEGKRPPIKEVITKVLGKRVMNAVQVYEAVKAKGQLPNSNDPKGYIGYLLSGSKITDPATGQDIPLWERVHEKGRGFYRNRSTVPQGKTATKAAPAAKAAPVAKTAKKTAVEAVASPASTAKKTVKCKVCQTPGHNSLGHAKWLAAGGAKAASAAKTAAKTAPVAKKTAAKAAPTAKTAKTSAKGKKQKCKVCQTEGHNSLGHANWLAKQANGAPAKPAAKTAAKTVPAAKAAAPAGKKTVKCKVCQTEGHNSLGHAKWAAKQGTNGAASAPKAKKGPTVVDHSATNGTTAAATPQAVTPDPEPAPAPVKVAPPAPVSAPAPVAAPVKTEAKTTDEILKEAGIDLSSSPLG